MRHLDIIKKTYLIIDEIQREKRPYYKNFRYLEEKIVFGIGVKYNIDVI